MISNSLEETKKIAGEFAAELCGGDIVFLEGDLGAGKTTFVQGVLESIGYTEPVRSPTFSIMNVYQIDSQRGQGTPPITFSQIIHLDFYRFENPKEIRALGLEEYFEDPKNVFLIEWPNRGLEHESAIVPTKRVSIQLTDDEVREISIE